MRMLFWLLAAIPCFANTSIVSIEPTQMQAKISIITDQPAFCTYRASRGTAFSSNLADLNDNGNTDTRAGALVNANVHLFVLGTRKGNDALAAASTYWVGVSCGSDTEVSAVFVTRSIEWATRLPIRSI